MLDFFNHQMTYPVVFHAFETKEPTLVYEDRSLTVTTIPLRHRMPTCGFLFAEKPRPNHIIREMIDFYQIPETIPNSRLTRPSDPPRSYAYCSDTLPLASVVEQVRGVDLLFHEATFVEEDAARAKETYHTTASQAASIAREAGVKRLLVGHFSARYDNEELLLEQARAVFPETLLAKETLCVPI